MSRWATFIASLVVLALSITLLVMRHGEHDVLGRAAKAFEMQSSYRTALTVVTEGPAQFGLQVTGAVDQRTKVARLDMHFTYPGTQRSVTCGMLSTGNAIYIPIAPKDRGRFGNKPWVESSIVGLLPIQGFGTEGFDPKTFANIDDLHQTGTDNVRGVATTTYRGTLHIDRSKLTAGAANVPSETGVKLWVSSDHLIRKLEETIAATQNNVSVTSTSTFEYFDFGVPVHIATPPASQIDHGDAQAAIVSCIS